ncbi:unnamed protein product [Colias eurytheme]|nr:unnamed protein product [Colias eurytheme]
MYALEQIKWDIVGLSEVRRLGENIVDHLDYLFYHIGETPGIEALIGSRGNAVAEWPHMYREQNRPPRPLLPASCPKCPHRTYDAYIHGTKA